jgi:16S rRNA (adenine1518-N6/adenine1519-N6)-dimethyltransferase
MAQTKNEIRALLEQHLLHPRHRLGQNFMVDQNLVRLIADAGEMQSGDLVIEVGPGTGTLTEELLARGANVLAVEIDRNLAELLRERFAGREGFTLIEGDALAGKHALNPRIVEAIENARLNDKSTRLVANLPYQIASPLVIEMLIAGVQSLTFTVQREVAERLRAQPNTPEYGPLTIMAQLLSRVEILRHLPPQAFWPMPKIESSLVYMQREDRLGGHAAAMSTFVHRIFSSRRKTLKNAIERAGVENASALLERVGLSPQIRPEEVSPQKALELFLQKS